ncbi:hypothetical protein NDU88_003777 [Pleurodeles waltl]|uniref:DUF4371 domain-containing protein n=1 Tax=Pleurodeles waltl TaxID=8319 RepID=A0AAV7SGW3_PLEWA|nr:hypothetical protein NDU88_003777 [Pleurodeles waltl]
MPSDTRCILFLLRTITQFPAHQETKMEQLNADDLADQILSHLVACDFKPEDILSQCYDGASVMSGCNGVFRLLYRKD